MIAATFCAFDDPVSNSLLVASVAFFAESVAYFPVVGQPSLSVYTPSNCALAMPASLGTQLTAGWVLANVTSGSGEAFFTKFCVTDPSGVPIRPSVPNGFGIGIWPSMSMPNGQYVISPWVGGGTVCLPSGQWCWG